jgi:hypothetical protein
VEEASRAAAIERLLLMGVAPADQIGKWPGWVSMVIQRVSVKLSMPCAAELAIAAVAHAAEGHLRLVMHGGAVDVADACLDLARHAKPRAPSRVKTALERP